MFRLLWWFFGGAGAEGRTICGTLAFAPLVSGELAVAPLIDGTLAFVEC